MAVHGFWSADLQPEALTSELGYWYFRKVGLTPIGAAFLGLGWRMRRMTLACNAWGDPTCGDRHVC